MRSLRCLAATALGLLALSLLVGADAPREVAATLAPFEPAEIECWRREDKFAHPPEITAPRFFYPFEMRRASIPGEVTVLVQIDEQGYARRLAVLASSHEAFSRAAAQALQQARWRAEPNRSGRLGTWFYYRAVYRLEG